MKQCLFFFVDQQWVTKAIWYNLWITLGFVHSMIFRQLHMKHFIDEYGITTSEVAFVQLIFLSWNTINDVFAGFFISFYTRKFGSRLQLALLNSCLWAFSSCIPFLPLPFLSAPVHYFISISIFDGCSSLSGVLMGSILASYTNSEKERVQYQRLNSIFGCVEFLIPFISLQLYETPNVFRLYLLAVAFGSTIISLISYRQFPKKSEQIQEADFSWEYWKLVFGEIQGQTSFWIFVFVSAMNECSFILLEQFLISFVTSLLPNFSPSARFTLITAVPPIGGAVSFLATWYVERYSVYFLYTNIFVAKCFFPLIYFFPESMFSYVFIAFLVLFQISVQLPDAFGKIIMGNLMCEYEQRTNKRNINTSIFYSIQALITKPLNSLAPPLGTYFLRDSDKASALSLFVFVPAICGVIQLMMWRYMKSIKAVKSISPSTEKVQLVEGLPKDGMLRKRPK